MKDGFTWALALRERLGGIRGVGLAGDKTDHLAERLTPEIRSLMPSPRYLELERMIAAAHRQLWRAQGLADELGGYETASDLQQIAQELARIQESLLKGVQRRMRL